MLCSMRVRLPNLGRKSTKITPLKIEKVNFFPTLLSYKASNGFYGQAYLVWRKQNLNRPIFIEIFCSLRVRLPNLGRKSTKNTPLKIENVHYFPIFLFYLPCYGFYGQKYLVWRKQDLKRPISIEILCSLRVRLPNLGRKSTKITPLKIENVNYFPILLFYIPFNGFHG